MLAITRFRVSEQDTAAFREHVCEALAAMGERPGYVRGHLGRATDDPGLWALVTEWEGVGAYRRALSSYDVKLAATGVLLQAIQEPGAFEVLESATRGGR